MSVVSQSTGDSILAGGKFGNGYLSVSGEPLYLYTWNSPDLLNYFLNLFAMGCGGSVLPASDVVPFLDLPWDYQGKGLSFSEAVTAIASYFDHEYPFLDVGSVLPEPEGARETITNFEGKFRNPTLNYSGHDGYDWLRPAGVS